MTAEEGPIAAQLRGLLADTVGPNRVILERELRDAGIPSRHAAALARASRTIETVVDLDEVVADFAERLTDDLARQRELRRVTDPAELARPVRRGW